SVPARAASRYSASRSKSCTRQAAAIASAAEAGMTPTRASARARPASKASIWRTWFSAPNTCVMAGVLKKKVSARSMGSGRPGLEVAQGGQLLLGGRGRLVEPIGELDRPAGLVTHLVAGHARVERYDGQLVRRRIVSHDGQVRDDQRRPGRADATPHAIVAALTEAE